MAHVEIEGGKESQFEEEIEPRLVDEARDIHSNGTGVEREDVGIFHQGQAVFAELSAYIFWDVFAISVLQFGHELLELRSLRLLAFCISIIAKQKSFPYWFFFPRSLLKEIPLLS